MRREPQRLIKMQKGFLAADAPDHFSIARIPSPPRPERLAALRRRPRVARHPTRGKERGEEEKIKVDLVNIPFVVIFIYCALSSPLMLVCMFFMMIFVADCYYKNSARALALCARTRATDGRSSPRC